MQSVLANSSLLSFPLAGIAVQRYEKERRQDGFIAHRTSAEANPCVMVYQEDGAKVLLDTDTTSWLHPATPPHNGAPFLKVALANTIYVGEDTTQPRNVFVVSADEVETSYVEQRTWASPLLLFGLLSPNEQALLSLALSLKQWGAANKFCGRCGAAMRCSDCGLTRSCTACRNRIHPSVTPAMIVAVLDGKGNVIMSERRQRSSAFTSPKPYRTVLSGFVAQGESMEETVVREVREETGAEVTRLRYVGSQPWPTPYELMTCYYAVAENSPTLVAEQAELLNVQWVSKEEVRQAMADQHPDFATVPAFTAAHVLLEKWVNGEVDDCGEVKRSA